MGSDVIEQERRAIAIEPVPGCIIEAAAPNPVLQRLHALVRKGYKAQIGTERASDTVVLRHLGKAPDLVLRADGSVAPYDGRWPRHKRKVAAPVPFGAQDVAEQLRFAQFLETVPKASLRDRTRPWRHKYIYLPIVGLILVGIHLAFTAMLLSS